MFVSALLQFEGSGTAGSTRTSTSSRQNANSQKAIVTKNTNAQFPIITQLNYVTGGKIALFVSTYS